MKLEKFFGQFHGDAVLRVYRSPAQKRWCIESWEAGRMQETMRVGYGDTIQQAIEQFVNNSKIV